MHDCLQLGLGPALLDKSTQNFVVNLLDDCIVFVAQDHMMAMMAGMNSVPKNGGDDCGSSIDENDMMTSSQDMTSQAQQQSDNDYRQMNEKSRGGAQSDDEMEGDDYSAGDIGVDIGGVVADDEDDEELPTQVKVRMRIQLSVMLSAVIRCEPSFTNKQNPTLSSSVSRSGLGFLMQ